MTHLVAQRLFDRSPDLINLANDALARKPALPAGPALMEPLQRRPARSISKAVHEKSAISATSRVLPPSRDFH